MFPWDVDLTEYELVQSSRVEQPSGRVDHTFVYEHSDRQAGEGRFRLRLVVSGDRPTELTHLLQIPEGFDRRYEEMRSANNGIAGGSLLAIALLYGVGAVVGLFVLLRRRWVLWRMPLICGASIAVLQALAAFNAWPLIWINYDTAVSESSFAIQQIVTILSSVVLFAILFTLSFMAAESLSRRAFPHHVQFWRCWSRDGARSWPIVGQTAAGYLAVGVMLAFLVAFYWITRSQLGWWSPSDALYEPDSVATVLPWLNPLAISLQAGFMEECLFRAVPLAGAALLGERFGRRRAWIAAAFVVQILVFGAAHANYPAQPAYARLVELILPSAAFGLLYLRFGLLPAIVMHFAFDAVLFSMPLFLSTASGAWIDRGLFVAIFLLPVWVVLAARVRGGAWIEAPAQLFNGAWQPPPAEPPQTQPQAAPSPRRTWSRCRRENDQRQTAVATARSASGILLWALLFAGAAVGVVRWSRGRFNVRAALAIGGLSLAMSVIGAANNLPILMNGLSTAQPVPLQLGMQVALILVGAGIVAAASLALPWLGVALASVQEFLVLTLAAMLIVTSANALTANGSRRLIAGAVGVFLVGFFLAPGPVPDNVMSWWLIGAVGGLLLLGAYVWILRAYPALVVLAAAALSVPGVVASGLARARNGALIGSLLATAGILVLAWRWFDRLTVEE